METTKESQDITKYIIYMKTILQWMGITVYELTIKTNTCAVLEFVQDDTVNPL